MNHQSSSQSYANPFSEPHDFSQLASDHPQLQPFLIKNRQDRISLDFFNPLAVKVFNRVLLKEHYNIEFWDFPDQFLCPPVPSRADYLSAVAPLLENQIKQIRCLDIGVGANCIYPLIGHMGYNWQFVGSDINKNAVESARHIVVANELNRAIVIRHQQNPEQIFLGVIKESEFFDLTICNPPFYASAEEASAATRRRLNYKNASGTVSSFSGVSNELWCAGGEFQFISKLIEESVQFADCCGWFTVLVSKGGNLDQIMGLLDAVGARVEVIPLQRGNKIRRIIAWSFKD